MNAIVEIVGPELNGKQGKKIATTDISGKKKEIGLYFSAHWCPPCRNFTPKLAEYYNAIKSTKADDLEIVFVSSDRSEEDSATYFEMMPWLMLPFSSGDIKSMLMQKYGVSGIPALVIIDGSTGDLITKEGRDRVGTD